MIFDNKKTDAGSGSKLSYKTSMNLFRGAGNTAGRQATASRGGTASGSGSASGTASAGVLPVRSYFTSAGLDPNQIGWNGSQVTYGGKTFTPYTNIDGKTFATKESMDSFISDVQKDNGNLGIRQTFANLGLNPNKLGWSNGQVTYNGIAFTPTVNANGTTYAPARDVYDFASRALRTQGDDIVQMNAYNNGYGINALGWNDAEKKVTVGGAQVPHLWIDDNGNAWGQASVLKAAYDDLAQKNGIKNAQQLFDEWQTNYADKLEDAYDEAMDRDFSFDLESNPLYQAYRRMYTREADRAYQDALGRAAARTGGYMSSMARSQAEQQRQYYMSKLGDAVPQIYAQAYEEFAKDRQSDIDALDRKYNLYGELYNNSVSASNAAADAFLRQQEAERSRKNNAYADALADMELETAESDAQKAIAQNTYDVYALYDVPFTKEIADKYGIAPNSDGTYPTANQIVARKQQEIWDKYARGEYSDKVAIDSQAQLELLAKQAVYDMQQLAVRYR